MFKSVIAGVDGGAGGADALALAELLADPGADVVPITVAPTQAPAVGLHEAAVTRSADLIVVGSSSRGLIGRVLAGDDVKATLRSAPCAVAVAPHGFAGESHAIEQIGVGYDGGAHSRIALDIAKAIAANTGAKLRVLGVAMPPQGLVDPVGISSVAAIEARHEQMQRLIAELDPEISAEAVDGIANEQLTALSSEVDLLVVGSSRRGTIGRVLLGSTSEQLSREASCPLLVAPAPE
jgi:nucleotide-binding universal stress UspA family protein